MKWRTTLICAVAAAAVAFVPAGCGGSGENTWTYVGTWTNSAYNGNSPGNGPPGKMVITATSIAIYTNDTDTTPWATASFNVSEDWISGGDHYFKGIATPPSSSSSQYFLMRVSNNNKTLELNADSNSYPTATDPAGPQYCIYTRH